MEIRDIYLYIAMYVCIVFLWYIHACIYELPRQYDEQQILHWSLGLSP